MSIVFAYCLYLELMYTDWDAYTKGLHWSTYGTWTRKKGAVQRNEIYHWK